MSAKNSKQGGAKSAKSTNPKKATLTFASLQVQRTRGGGSSKGGRFNPKSRRLVIPTSFAGKKVAIIADGDLLIVGGEGIYACHPTQHFVTVPVGVVSNATKPVSLEVVETPAKVQGIDLPEGMVAYRLPKAEAKAGAKAKAKAEAKAEAKPADK